MLSILHPTIIASVLEYPGGLMPVRHAGTGKLLLILKIHKEYILAARIHGGFSFYLAPLPSSSGLTVALATAFFDDSDEPLLVRTPLFNEPLGNELLELLTYDKFEVYFFDEHGREWMGHYASLHDGGSVLTTGVAFDLLTYHPRTVDSVYEALDIWFGNRTADDDTRALRVTFTEEISPSDIFIQNSLPEHHDYHGSGGYSYSLLERSNPGYFQERDIVAGLKRSFPGKRIALNPMRRDTGKEFVDVMAWNDTHLILVQAKDSPNTEASLSRSINRKRRTSQSQIEKGVKQAKGAVAYVRDHPKLELLIDKIDFDLQVDDKKIISMVVVQEMFTDEGETFVARYREMRNISDVFVLLDYAAFNSFCHEFTNEYDLAEALASYCARITSGTTWLDPRPYILDAIQSRLNNTPDLGNK